MWKLFEKGMWKVKEENLINWACNYYEMHSNYHEMHNKSDSNFKMTSLLKKSLSNLFKIYNL